MREGLYESLINGRLGDELDRLTDLTASTGPVDEADAPHVLARYVGELLEARLRAIRDPDERLRTVNQLVTQLAGPPDAIAAPVRQLLSIEGPAGPGNVSVSSRPRTPLSDAALLTNSSDEPSLGAELRAEIDSADEVDLLCAFVKWYGLRLLEPELERARERGVPLRVITTTYMGATEREALDRLIRMFGATVKIQYDAHRTRLHAKAWMFRRANVIRHGVRRLLQPVARRVARWRRMECSTVSGRHPGTSREVPSHVRHLLERLILRVLRPRPRSRPARRRARRGIWTHNARPGHHLARRTGGTAIRVPAGDARSHRRRAFSPRPSSESRGGSNRHRQDRHCGPGLPQPLRQQRRATLAAVHCTSTRDPRAVAAHLPRGSGGRVVRRVVRRRSQAGAVAPCLRQRSVAQLIRHHQHPCRRLRDRRDRRVPPCGGRVVSAHHRSPRAGGVAGADGHTGTCRRRRRAVVLRQSHRSRASALGRPRGRPALSLPLLRRRRRDGPAGGRLDAWSLRRGRTVQRVHGQQRPRRDRPVPAPRQDLESWRDAGAGLLRQRCSRGVHGPRLHRGRHSGSCSQRRHAAGTSETRPWTTFGIVG